MRKLLGIFLAVILLVTCAGCGGDNKPAEQPKQEAAQEMSDKVGALMPIGLDEEGYKTWTKSIAEVEGQPAEYKVPHTVVFFNDLNSMLAALKAKQIDRFAASKRVADYIAARNDDVQIIDYNLKPILGYSMAVEEKNAATIEEINKAINAMKEDGTLDKLIEDNITNLKGDPAPVEIAKIDGADTIKVAVTGDMPGMDCILADGTPAGFNVAFLSELSKRINKNFELVSISSDARGAALSSGQVDALFWVIGTYDQDGKALPYPLDSMKGVAISVPYMMDSRVGLSLKK
ncbi:MAG: transporter substrate-binding domain-containing protein [Selenomonadaceae bacterium]|nr:transporter substrate-binding domain-containing protein [Selenomonadaceae bacterium]